MAGQHRRWPTARARMGPLVNDETVEDRFKALAQGIHFDG